jgi:GT2 family glycosyltransferase
MTASSVRLSDGRSLTVAPGRQPETSAAVLIVNYKAYDELQVCLASLMPRLRPGDEVMVVDYQSDPRALVGVSGRYPSVGTIPCRDNQGFAAGVNMAAARTRAPYLLLLNPDTVVHGPIVQVLGDWLTSHPDVGVVAPRVLNPDGSVQATARRFPNATTALAGRSTWLTRRFPNNWLSRWNLVARDADAPADVDWVSGACLMTRRDLFERLGGLDERFFLYWEDADYCRRAAAAGARRTYLPSVSVTHTGGCSSDRSPAQSIRSFHRSAYWLYTKEARWWGRAMAQAVRGGLWLRGEWRVRRHVPLSEIDGRKPFQRPTEVARRTADVSVD